MRYMNMQMYVWLAWCQYKVNSCHAGDARRPQQILLTESL